MRRFFSIDNNRNGRKPESLLCEAGEKFFKDLKYEREKGSTINGLCLRFAQVVLLPERMVVS
jgi:hypothetical protein